MSRRERPMLIEHPIRIKAYEIDAMGVVSNIEYIKWFEDLRHVFLDAYYPYEEMMRDRISPVMMTTEVHYHRPLTLHDRPLGRSWVVRMGRAKWEIHFEFTTEAGLHCSGRQIGGFYDVAKGRPTSIPDRLRNAFERETAAV